MRKRSHGEAKLSSASRSAASAASSANSSSAIGRAEAMYQSYNTGAHGMGEMSGDIQQSQGSNVQPSGISSILSSSSSTTSSDAALLQHQAMHPQQFMHHMEQQHAHQQMQIMSEGMDSSAIVSPGFLVSGSPFQMSGSPPARPKKGGASQKAGQKRPSERKSKMPSMTAPPLSSPMIAMQYQQQMSPTSWLAPVPDETSTATELSPSFLAMQRNQQYPSSSVINSASTSSASSMWAQPQTSNGVSVVRAQLPQRGEALASDDISGLHQTGTANQKFGVSTMSHDDMDEYSDDNTEEVAAAESNEGKSRRRLPPQLLGGASGSQHRAVTADVDVDQQLGKQLGRSSNRLHDFGRSACDVDAPVPGDRYGSPPLVGGPSILPGSGGPHSNDSHLYLLSASGRLSAPSVPQTIDTSPHLVSGMSNDGMGVTLSSWQLLTGLSDSRGGHNPQSSWKGKIQETPGFDRLADPSAFDVGIGPYTSNGRLDNPSNDLKRRSDQRHTPTQVINHRNSPTLLDDSIESLADMSNDRGKKRSKGLESSEFISEASSSSSSFSRVPQMNLFFATPIGNTGMAASPPEHSIPLVERGTVSPALGNPTNGSISMPMMRQAAPAVDTFLAPFDQANSASSARIRSAKFYSQSALRPVPSRAATANHHSSTSGGASSALLNYGFSPLEPTGGVLGSDLGQQLGGQQQQPIIMEPLPVPWPATDSGAAGIGEASLSHGEMSGSLSHSFSNMLVEDVGGGGGGGGGGVGGVGSGGGKKEKDDFKNRGVIHELILEEDSIDV